MPAVVTFTQLDHLRHISSDIALYLLSAEVLRLSFLLLSLYKIKHIIDESVSCCLLCSRTTSPAFPDLTSGAELTPSLSAAKVQWRAQGIFLLLFNCDCPPLGHSHLEQWSLTTNRVKMDGL